MLSDASSGPTPPVEPLGVVSLTNATIYPVHPSSSPLRMHYGVLREDGTLLQSTVEDRHHGEHLFMPPDPTRFDAIDSTSRDAIYAGPLYHVYGHFIIESCQRLWWAADHPDLPIVWTADDKTAPELNRWERDILEILGIRNEVIILTRPTRFDRLYVPDAGYKYADWSHPQHIAFLAAYGGPPLEPGTKLWLSRDPAHGRGVINRHIIERRLHELGWTIVTFELMPVRAQLDALSRAELIAGEEASTFHNLLLLKDIRGKRFDVFRRAGPEHRSFRTIGDAREVDQHFHSSSHDAVISIRGRAVVRLAPNPAQYLSHLGVPIPQPQTLPSNGKPGHTIRRLNRLAEITGAESYLQLGWHDHAAFTQVGVPHRDIVDDEFRFDVRSYRNQGAHFYEVSLEQFLTWFAQERTYDLVMLDNQQDWRDAVDKICAVFTRAAHDRTVVVLDLRAESGGQGTPGGAGLFKTVLALHDHHPELDFRTIKSDGDAQTVIWQRRRTVPRRFAGVEEIEALAYADVGRYRDLFALVTEDKAMAEVQDWLFPRPIDRSYRLPVATPTSKLGFSALYDALRERTRMLQSLRRTVVTTVKPRVSQSTWEKLRKFDHRLRGQAYRGEVEPSQQTADEEPKAGEPEQAAAESKPMDEWDLTSLARYFGTDKWGPHRYAPHYERHFRRFKNDTFTLFEIGIGGYSRENLGGASLRMWKAFFPKAHIVGLDIEDKSFVEEPRIAAFRGSQTNEPLLRTIIGEAENLRIVIDDGSHRPEHIRQTFDVIFPLLPAGSLYAIEDTQTSYWPRYGGSLALDDPSTTMGLVKRLVDGLNYEEWEDEDNPATAADRNIIAIHCYHNLVILEKGPNNEGTRRGWRERAKPE